jgi:hypothetical protein
MRPRRHVPLALTCAAVLLTGCGGSSLLDGSTANELQDSLTTVRAAIDDGRCSEARSAAREGLQRVEELPSSVDSDLRRTLKDGFDELETRVGSDCEEPVTTTTAPTTTEEAPTTTVPPVEEPTTTQEQPETTTDEAPTDPTTTDEGPTTDPDDGGFVPDDSGGVAPEVDGPGATERSVRKRLEKLRKRAEKFRGRGNG